MPAITKDTVLLHRLQKSSESVEVHLAAGDPVSIVKEWADHYLIRTSDGKVFNVGKDCVDPSA
jgi:hypothetical protein